MCWYPEREPDPTDAKRAPQTNGRQPPPPRARRTPHAAKKMSRRGRSSGPAPAPAETEAEAEAEASYDAFTAPGGGAVAPPPHATHPTPHASLPHTPTPPCTARALTGVPGRPSCRSSRGRSSTRRPTSSSACSTSGAMPARPPVVGDRDTG